MNPLLKTIGNIGSTIQRVGDRTLVPMAEAPVNIGSTILGNLQRDTAPPKTQQLPPTIHSPIPQSQVVPHQQASSWLGMGINNTENALRLGMNNVTNNIGAGLSRLLPGNQVTPPSAIHPIMNHVVNRFAAPTQQPPQAGFQIGNSLPPGLVPFGQGIRNQTAQAQPTQAPVQNPAQPTQTPIQPTQPGVRQVPQMPTQIPGVTPEVSQHFLNIMQQVLPITRQYGIPDAVAAAQAAQESGYGTSQAAQANNYFGLMHWDPQTGKRSLHTFATPQQAATFYAQTVTSLVPNIQNMSPYQALQALQSGKQHYEGDNADPMQYVRDVSANPAWQAFGGGQ